MEELFQVLSSSARIVRNARKPKAPPASSNGTPISASTGTPPSASGLTSTFDAGKSRDIHREEVARFRRSLHIHVKSTGHTIPDPIVTFQDLACPTTWWTGDTERFDRTYHVIMSNLEKGRWKEPTAIQMQVIPSLMARKDTIANAPTGSGKSGAFIVPLILLSVAADSDFYSSSDFRNTSSNARRSPRCLVLVPSLELASQLHNEFERLAQGLRFRSCLLCKSNAKQLIAGDIGGAVGLDVLVATPLRLVDCVENGFKIVGVRCVVLDEADRLLDAADGHSRLDAASGSGSSRSKSFLDQVDTILADIPGTAVRALFSATVTPAVKSLAQSLMRSPIDVSVRASQPGGANPHIEQKLLFVGKEQGKVLAIRQMLARGELHPPVLMFCNSQDRAQALFEELLYDRVRIDVLHAGRSKAARDSAVAKLRSGETWVLVCTDLVARGLDFRAVKMVINFDVPESGITYIHRIGRTGRAGREGKAVTLCTEVDLGNLRTLANVMKQSGCPVEDWLLDLRRVSRNDRRLHASQSIPRMDRQRRVGGRKRKRNCEK
jgi:ATP-dependent RNA helicase DDX52/ROK1